MVSTPSSSPCAGKNSPYRDRSVEENLEMFRKMKAGDYEEGSHVLGAKIDMESPNLNMRDPAMYRIRKARHDMTGDTWKIYPMYDFAHCISDAIEGITHSTRSALLSSKTTGPSMTGS
eukprot:Tamp_29519.p1 GENE.Tamp_29519~~Tamp_29519.p1  ORF type:complete len:118 (+),score=13.79 Tamp_29519:235-588(+)